MRTSSRTAVVTILIPSIISSSAAFTACPSSLNFMQTRSVCGRYDDPLSVCTSLNSQHRNVKSRLNMIGTRPNVQSRDFYAILEVPRGADVADIKRAYRKLAKKYHPDANPDEDTTEQFQDINRAYEVLSNDELRKRYDQFGEAGIGTSAASDASASSPFGGGAGFSQQVDLGDIFDTFFGGGGGGFGGTRTRGPIPGDDLRYDLEVDFQTAVFGGEETIKVRHLETCETCDGDVAKPGAAIKTCTTCGGSGVTVTVQRTPLGTIQSQQTCPTCLGEGKTVEEYCGTCSGKGVVTKTKKIKVTIPAGVQDGNKLRVRGEGDAGPKGGPAGDLYIFLKVKEDETFRREGSDVYSDTIVNYVDAILGASMKVKVVDGEVTIKIPPGSQPGQVMRLREKGAPMIGDPNKRGDHYLTLNVEIPKKISGEEEKLVKTLRDLRDGKRKGKRGGKGWFGKEE